MLSASAQPVRARLLGQGVPSVLRPVLRAYVLGYASSTAPRVLTLLLLHLSRRRKNIDPKPEDCFLPSLVRVLKGGLEIQRFPTFCAALVGGSTLLEARDSPPSSHILPVDIVKIPLRRLFARLALSISELAQLR